MISSHTSLSHIPFNLSHAPLTSLHVCHFAKTCPHFSIHPTFFENCPPFAHFDKTAYTYNTWFARFLKMEPRAHTFWFIPRFLKMWNWGAIFKNVGTVLPGQGAWTRPALVEVGGLHKNLYRVETQNKHKTKVGAPPFPPGAPHLHKGRGKVSRPSTRGNLVVCLFAVLLLFCFQ